MVDDGSGAPGLVASRLRECPGFCGRVLGSTADENITYSGCQGCSWGSRSWGSNSVCTICSEPLALYDWLYLLFVAIVPLFFHSLFVHIYTTKHCSRRLQFVHHMCCFAECVLSSVFSLVVVPPRGSLHLHGCRKWSLKEWYPIFYNPIVNHTYPLRYSLPFIYLAFCLLTLLGLRSCLYATLFRKTAISPKPYYAALHTIPLLALTHFLFAGLLYYSYPYIILVCSLIINATHMAVVRGCRIGTVCKKAFSRLKNILMIFVHMSLFGFSLVVLMLNFPYGKPFSVISIICIPLPFLYYCCVAGLSHPKFFEFKEEVRHGSFTAASVVLKIAKQWPLEVY